VWVWVCVCVACVCGGVYVCVFCVCVCARVCVCLCVRPNDWAPVWVSCKSWFDSWKEQKTFSSQNVQANTASYQQIPAAPSQRRETSFSSNIEVKQNGAISRLRPYAVTACTFAVSIQDSHKFI